MHKNDELKSDALGQVSGVKTSLDVVRSRVSSAMSEADIVLKEAITKAAKAL